MGNRRLNLALPLALFAAASCEVVDKVQPTPVAEFGLWEDSAGDVQNPMLARLCTDVWNWSLANDPLWATYLGDPRYHGELPNLSERARANDVEQLGLFRERLDELRMENMSALDLEVASFLDGRLAAEKSVRELELGWTVDPLSGPLVRLLNVVQVQPVRTARERGDVLARWAAIPGYLREASATARLGAIEGRISNKTAIEKQLEHLDAFLAQDPMDSPFVALATGGGRWVTLPKDGNLARVAHEELGDSRDQRDLALLNLHISDPTRVAAGTRVLIPLAGDPLDAKTRGEFLSEALEVVEAEVYPAVSAYRDTLGSLLPRARSDDKPGLSALADGAQTYRTLIAYHTSLPLAEADPAAIHEFGLAEVQSIRAELAEVGQRVFGTSDVADIQARLRSDPAMHFTSGDEIVAKADSSLRRAQSRLPGFFGLRPRAACSVRAIPAHEAENSTVAYYDAPEANGNRPGIYYVNTSKPTTRTRYEAEVLAFHESIPGHHLQIAIAQELQGLPLCVRHGGWTAFIEGWALYVERLAEEMGLYSGDVDRLGMLSFDAWRASRLVVDTGLHAMGWSRAQAIEYLNANTLLAPNNIENEVDRYIAWPGQALAYKIGSREIHDLRDEAQSALGARFSYPAFHDAVLKHGAVSLAGLRENVRAWIRSEGGTPEEPAIEASARAR
jgi:uncharacterized protein (DUF885 family)